MKNKKWLLLLIIAFPSLFWLILESSTIQSRKLPFYGPKKAVSPVDTQYYQVSRSFQGISESGQLTGKTPEPKGSFVLSFLHPKYLPEAYRLDGFWEYLNYKPDKISGIEFYFLCPVNAITEIPSELQKFKAFSNIHFAGWKEQRFDSLWRSYFRDKPYYIDSSFFILIDANNHLRGYYDMRYASEMKRLIEEYQHLRLKEEKQLIMEENEIKSLN